MFKIHYDTFFANKKTIVAFIMLCLALIISPFTPDLEGEYIYSKGRRDPEGSIYNLTNTGLTLFWCGIMLSIFIVGTVVTSIKIKI